MRLVLHVGMGKTGTSSIQHALRVNRAKLADQGAEYLGMWLDMIDPAYKGFHEQKVFFRAAPSVIEAGGRTLLEFLRCREAETFILSNESWSGQGFTMRPLVDILRQGGVAVEVVAYARNPLTWLPSAHVQWSIRDKMNKGDVRQFSTSARALVRWYRDLLTWRESMGDDLRVRQYEAAPDVVADFAEAIGVDIDKPKERVLERGEDAEILLRALFNQQFDAPQPPERFDHAVMKSLSDTIAINDMMARCFDYTEAEAIIEESGDVFDALTEAFGFDLREGDRRPPTMPDATKLRERLLDYLLRVVLSQSVRIKSLEHRLEKIDKGD